MKLNYKGGIYKSLTFEIQDAVYRNPKIDVSSIRQTDGSMLKLILLRRVYQ